MRTRENVRDRIPVGRGSLIGGFGGDELPVGITRGNLARERPNIGDFAHLLGVAFDHLAFGVARDRDELAYELHRDKGGAVLDLGLDDIGLVDADETRLHLLAAALAFADRALEALIDLVAEGIFQGRLAPLGASP